MLATTSQSGVGRLAASTPIAVDFGSSLTVVARGRIVVVIASVVTALNVHDRVSDPAAFGRQVEVGGLRTAKRLSGLCWRGGRLYSGCWPDCH